MKILKILIFVFCLYLVGCNDRNRRQSSFVFIDLTYSNGWNEIASIHLDSNRTINIRLIHHGQPKSLFEDTIDEPTFYKIDSLVVAAFKTNYDSVIGTPVPDGGGYNIILKTKTKEIQTMIFRPATSSADLDSLITTVLSLKNKFKKVTTDTSFIFQSYWRLAPIPPLDTLVTFVPPIIKIDQLDTSASR